MLHVDSEDVLHLEYLTHPAWANILKVLLLLTFLIGIAVEGRAGPAPVESQNTHGSSVQKSFHFITFVNFVDRYLELNHSLFMSFSGAARLSQVLDQGVESFIVTFL